MESEPKNGSSFSFTVWLGIAASTSPKHDSFPRHLTGMRVLIVDDNKNARVVLGNIMESVQFRVDSVPSGESAVDAANKARHEGDPYELILMDMLMDGIDGIEATRRIRADSNSVITSYSIHYTKLYELGGGLHRFHGFLAGVR